MKLLKLHEIVFCEQRPADESWCTVDTHTHTGGRLLRSQETDKWRRLGFVDKYVTANYYVDMDETRKCVRVCVRDAETSAGSTITSESNYLLSPMALQAHTSHVMFHSFSSVFFFFCFKFFAHSISIWYSDRDRIARTTNARSHWKMEWSESASSYIKPFFFCVRRAFAKLKTFTVTRLTGKSIDFAYHSCVCVPSSSQCLRSMPLLCDAMACARFDAFVTVKLKHDLTKARWSIQSSRVEQAALPAFNSPQRHLRLLCVYSVVCV